MSMALMLRGFSRKASLPGRGARGMLLELLSLLMNSENTRLSGMEHHVFIISRYRLVSTRPAATHPRLASSKRVSPKHLIHFLAMMSNKGVVDAQLMQVWPL